MQSAEGQDRPNAQEVANFAWALQRFKDVPSPAVSAAMLSRMLGLCVIAGQQPNSQDISNFLLAYAELRIELPQQQADALVTHFLRPACQCKLWQTQHGVWLSWEFCSLTPYRQLLQRLHAQPGSLDRITKGELRQLYLALDWLTPPPGTSLQHHKTWSELQAELRHLGPLLA